MSVQANSLNQNSSVDLRNTFIKIERPQPPNPVEVDIPNPNRAGQRRLRTENCALAKNAMPDELVDILMKYGNNPKNWNPLNYAIEVDDFSAARILINYLGNCDVKEINDWRFPLDRLIQKIVVQDKSISNDQEQVLKNMILLKFQNAGGINSAFYWIAKYGEPGFVEWLLNQGIDLNASDGYPFLGAVDSGRKPLVEYLLSKGADLSRAKGVLNTAVSSGNLELVKFLWEQKGQRPYIPWGNPLYVAILKKHFDILRYLLQVGVSPNDYQKVLPFALSLSEATPQEKEYKRSVIELLLKYGAKL